MGPHVNKSNMDVKNTMQVLQMPRNFLFTTHCVIKRYAIIKYNQIIFA